MASPLIPLVDETAFSYLAIQRGKISHLVSERSAWTLAYAESLDADFASMAAHLPRDVGSVLDVGGGMSGISILLDRHYRAPGAQFYVLDGDNEAPVMVKHHRPFNSLEVTRHFLNRNGVALAFGISPAMELQPPPPCGLIISLQSWCFHYNPETYLDYVKGCTRPGTVLILDVRKDYKIWKRSLEAAFGKPVAIVQETEKSERTVFCV